MNVLGTHKTHAVDKGYLYKLGVHGLAHGMALHTPGVTLRAVHLQIRNTCIEILYQKFEHDMSILIGNIFQW